VWPFLTFRFTYYYSQEDIMGGGTSKPSVSKKDTEVLTMHPSWESHVNEEKNSGFSFSLINVHISCALGTILFALCCMICVLLCYLGYRRFCHPKKKNKEATTAPPPPSMCATCLSCSPPSSTSLRPWDKEVMEDRYYASMRQQDYDDYDAMNNRVMSQDSFITTEAGLWIQWSSFVNFCRQLLWLTLWLLLLLLLRLLLHWLKFSYLRLSRSILAPTLLLHDSPRKTQY
jgi:hypothetical protein